MAMMRRDQIFRWTTETLDMGWEAIEAAWEWFWDHDATSLVAGVLIAVPVLAVSFVVGVSIRLWRMRKR